MEALRAAALIDLRSYLCDCVETDVFRAGVLLFCCIFARGVVEMMICFSKDFRANGDWNDSTGRLAKLSLICGEQPKRRQEKSLCSSSRTLLRRATNSASAFSWLATNAAFSSSSLDSLCLSSALSPFAVLSRALQRAMPSKRLASLSAVTLACRGRFST